MQPLTPSDRTLLADNAIGNKWQLAKRAELDPGFVGHLKGADHASRQRILVAAAKAFCGRSRRARLNWYQVTWPVLVILIIIGLSVWAIRRDLAYHPFPVSQAKVVAVAGLNPFHLIVRSDLKPGKSPPDSASLQLIDRAIGRYSKQYLPANAALDASTLSTGPPLTSELNNCVIVRIKIVTTTVFTGMPTPFSAAILASAHEPGAAPLLVGKVVVLDLQKDGDAMSAVLAIPAADQSSFASFASRSDFYLVATKH